ncbi:hypothetical protein N7476_007543 [Penicillium atrosanguineum]|uniref:Uncharacterized protein n=1 Tax=Penicillium atrosanguineum TaxID=1132637 RepID=A0A9W9PXL6_9EURO|nr:hypothetical protein N7476_007543 [Penicillium atrosanguineum]
MKSLFFVLFTFTLEISTHVGWWKMFKIIFPLSVLSVGGVLFAWVLVIAYVQRKLILWTEEHSDVAKSLLGRPLLFPTRLTHSRMFPEKYNYWINYFLVGIPVGLRGHIGSLMAIDSDATSPHSQSGNFFKSPVTKVLRKLLWFRVDPSLYLHRGDGHLGLMAKLDSFLKEQGENPEEYPYAYLVTIPAFLWWTKSPISYWYLYSPLKDLSAMILEVNNSYGEKRNVFMRLIPENTLTEGKKCEMISTASGRGCSGTQTFEFTSSVPTAKCYKCSWDKDIFASPFERVEGSFNLRFVDPLDPSPAKGGPLHNNMTLISTCGKPKVTSRLFSCAPPLDPLQASSWEVTIFLVKWSFIIPISLGRIVVEALRIRLRGNMPYLNKPDVKRKSIPQPFFRHYLSHLVDTCTFPLELTYIPAKSLHIKPVSMHSPIETEPRPTLTIQPLTPQFYTNILKYTDPALGFATEMENMPQPCDPISQRLWASDGGLLQKLIACARAPVASEGARVFPPWQRKNIAKSFMDTHIESNFPIRACRKYWAARFHCYITERFAHGSYRIVAVYGFFVSLMSMWAFLRWLGWITYGSTATVRPEYFLVVSSVGFAGVMLWEGFWGWIYGWPELYV